MGKSVAAGLRAAGRSGGQALPGLIVEKTVPGYLAKMLGQLPGGVVIITGTNGKTTTTKMVVELLAENGQRVLTNATGSNMTRGIISSVSQNATKSGRLPFDFAVFELDEAYARLFVKAVRPRWVLGLNASRDQLDRFGEVDTVASYIGQAMAAATDGVITNADDRLLRTQADNCQAPVHYFGIADELLKFFPRDNELVAVGGKLPTKRSLDLSPDVVLTRFADSSATYTISGKDYSAQLQVTGQHNFQNAAAALALVGCLLPDVTAERLVKSLGHVRPAFGRGQEFSLKNGSALQLALVKNPASFRQGMASYAGRNTKVLIAINDRIADSRDMSWLWDVDFTSLGGRSICLTGSRAYDMAMRLQYDGVSAEEIEPDIDQALKTFCGQPGDKVIFASYTAMLKIHKLLLAKAGKNL